MNVFKILKSVSGKLVMGAPQLLAIGVVGGMAVYGAYEADNTFASKERPIRSLSAITSSSAQEGLQQKNGLLTSINIKDSLNQVATAEERAAMEANSGAADNFGLDAVDNIQNVSFGSAAGTSATDGLGMGANKAVETGPVPGKTSAAGTGAVVNPGAVAAAAHGSAQAAAGSSQPTLGKASMARASGNAFNAAAGSISGSSASGSSSRSSGVRGGSGQGGAGGAEGYKLSGSMPSGSNAVSAMGLSRSGSSFMAGGRNSTSSRGRRSFSEKDDLKNISKRSADAASNRNRAANEGSRAFLASNRNSGGMTVEGGVDTESTGSADFSAPEASKLKAVGDWTQGEDDFAEKQDKARKRLMWMILGLVALTLVAMPLGYHLISKGKMAVPLSAGLIAAGWVVLGIAMAAAATVIGFAGAYQKNYNGLFLPISGYLVGVAAITALIYAGVSAMKVGAAGDVAAKAKFMGKTLGALKGVGMMGLTQGGSTLVQKGLEADQKAAQEKK